MIDFLNANAHANPNANANAKVLLTLFLQRSDAFLSCSNPLLNA